MLRVKTFKTKTFIYTHSLILFTIYNFFLQTNNNMVIVFE